MNEPSFSPCPYLGLLRDRSSIYIGVTPEHRCYAHERLIAPDHQHQGHFCLGENHSACSIYQASTSSGNQPQSYIGEETPTDEMPIEMTAAAANGIDLQVAEQASPETVQPAIAQSAVASTDKMQNGNVSKGPAEQSEPSASNGGKNTLPNLDNRERNYLDSGTVEAGGDIPLQNTTYQNSQHYPHQPQPNYLPSPWATTQPQNHPLAGNGSYQPPQESLTYASPIGYQVPTGHVMHPNYSWQSPSQVEYQLVPVGTLQSGANWHEPEPPKQVNWVQISTLAAATILVLIASALLYSSLSNSALGTQSDQDESFSDADISAILSNAAVPSTTLTLVDIAPTSVDVVQPEGEDVNVVSALDAPALTAQGSVEVPLIEDAMGERVAEQLAIPTDQAAMATAANLDGINISIRPALGDVIWWKSDDTFLNHQSDTIFYAGTYADQSYVAGIRFDLTDLPENSTLLGTTLHLTGMEDNRFRANDNSAWLVQLIAETDVDAWQEATFDEISTIPASHLLFPLLNSADLAVRRTNRWIFDRSTQQWLEEQIQGGAQAVYIRILPIASGNETLFGWDSGIGSQTSGAGPELILSLGESSINARSISTGTIEISPLSTLIPMPDNVLTGAMQAATATAEAQLNTLTDLIPSDTSAANNTSATEQVAPIPTATLLP